MSKNPFQEPRPSVFGLLKQKRNMVGGSHQEPDQDDSGGSGDSDADDARKPSGPKLKKMLMRKPRRGK